jgi:4'-phosphopantetheinyl transferase
VVIIYKLLVDRDLSQNEVSKLVSYVDFDRRERIKQFQFYESAQKCLLGDILARISICKKLNARNDSLVFGANYYGKPILLEPPGIHFNISHSGNWVVCAVANSPLGIDVENIRPVDLEVAKRFFTEEEYHFISSQEDIDKLRCFYTLWTLKESYVKYVGKGLSIAFDSFSVIPKNPNNINIKISEDFKPLFINQKLDCNHVLSLCFSKKVQIREEYFNITELYKITQMFL